MEKHLAQAKILSNESIAPEIFSMLLHAPEIAESARAGQFVMVYLDRGEMLLPRPISICDADSAGTVELVYQVVGKGTAAMSQLKQGAQIKILAPLGNGFNIGDLSQQASRRLEDEISREEEKCGAGRAPSVDGLSLQASRRLEDENNFVGAGRENKKRVAIIGGGIGTPPLFFLAKTLAQHGIEFDIFLGFRDTPILIEKFQKIAREKIFIATENGSVGHHGRVTEIFALREKNYDEIFSCGPEPLLRSVADFAREKNTPCQVSMEERMACGLGTCVGCVVKVADEYVRVCCEGPVFFASEVFK
jgi:dihydroorotate dehydrogenase electron transfer subunit